MGILVKTFVLITSLLLLSNCDSTFNSAEQTLIRDYNKIINFVTPDLTRDDAKNCPWLDQSSDNEFDGVINSITVHCLFTKNQLTLARIGIEEKTIGEDVLPALIQLYGEPSRIEDAWVAPDGTSRPEIKWSFPNHIALIEHKAYVPLDEFKEQFMPSETVVRITPE